MNDFYNIVNGMEDQQNALIVGLFGATMLIFKDKIIQIFNILSYKKKHYKRAKAIELIHHDVFNALPRAVRKVGVQKYYTHGQYDRVKTRMCIDFTEKKAEHCGKHMVSILNTNNIDTMKSDKLKHLIIDAQNKMHDDYISAIIRLWESKNIKKEDIDYIVHLFEKFRYDVVAAFGYRIEAIFGSTYNRNNFDKLLAVYNMWAMGIDLLPKDMQTTFENLNGKFKDLDY